MTQIIKTPLTKDARDTLKKGAQVLLSGVIYTARDAAHKKIKEHFLATGEMLLKGETIYYAGPCPSKSGEVIGSVGPTTSCRMDAYAQLFAKNGCLATIGKGKRATFAVEAIENNGGVHFEAIGGAGAYYKNCVKKSEPVYFPELGAEAVYRLEVENFPVIVSICPQGDRA